jgi:hypothetical protein
MKTAASLVFVFLLQLTLLGAERPEYAASFDPTKGFKPAQRDLTEVFLQIAGSLEHYGSPVPYMRHTVAEHSRIEALFRQKRGTAPKSFRPAYMTDGYVDRFAANWDTLSPKLGLEPFTKEVGSLMRDAIKGTRGTGTMIVEIFNQHQAQVFAAMTGRAGPADFETLRTQLVTRLELDQKTVDEGKYEVSRRDAVRVAIIIHGITMKLFKQLDQNLKPSDAERIKTALTAVFVDVGRLAQSELEAGILENAIQPRSAAAK